jgi:hypothetical protein
MAITRTKTTEQVIKETKLRISSLSGIPDELKERFLRAVAKYDVADEEIRKVSYELQSTGKWDNLHGKRKLC